MKKVYSAASLVDAQIIHDHLQSAGYNVLITGAALTSGIGELPADITPSVCVIDNGEYLSARALAQEIAMDLKNQDIQKTWQCSNCKEILPQNFGQCWQCGKEKNTLA